MFTTILFSRGTAIGFLSSSSFINAVATSFSNRDRSRGRSLAACRGASGPAFASTGCCARSPFGAFGFFCCSLFFCSSAIVVAAFSITVSEWIPVREECNFVRGQNRNLKTLVFSNYKLYRFLACQIYLSSVVPHFLQTRTLRSPRTSCPI